MTKKDLIKMFQALTDDIEIIVIDDNGNEFTAGAAYDIDSRGNGRILIAGCNKKTQY